MYITNLHHYIVLPQASAALCSPRPRFVARSVRGRVHDVSVPSFHACMKYKVFQKMTDDQREYRKLMAMAM